MNRSHRPSFDLLEDRLVPAMIKVTTVADIISSDSVISLREAVDLANALPGPDTIKLKAGVYKIALAGADNNNAAGDFDIFNSLTIIGKGADETAIESNDAGVNRERLFDVLGDGDVAFTKLTLRKAGNFSILGGAVQALTANILMTNCKVTDNVALTGGGLHTETGASQVTLVNCVFSRNVAKMDGGGINIGDSSNLHGPLHLTNSHIRRNFAGINGGGIYAPTVTLLSSTVQGNSALVGGGIVAGSASLTGSTVHGNSSTGNAGGGILAETVMVTDSIVSGNDAYGSGGGIFADTATLTNSTVSGNSAGADGNGGGIFASTAVTLTNSTVTGNAANFFNGGGIFTIVGTATLTDSTVSNNFAAGDGGGIVAEWANLTKSTVTGNRAGASGGGIQGDRVDLKSGSIVSGNFARFGGGLQCITVHGFDSTVNDNFASDDGGGIFADTANLVGSTVSGNRSGADGGGLRALTANLVNSTVSGNSAALTGGGIWAFEGNLVNVTVTENIATRGGGVLHLAEGDFGVLNTILAQNLSGFSGSAPDVLGGFTSLGHNLIGDPTGSTGFSNGVNGDQVGTAANPIDPMLGPLANNGGPTPTHALLAGSPAIDHGDNTAIDPISGLPLATDQRGVGFPRKKDGNADGISLIDIGAFES